MTTKFHPTLLSKRLRTCVVSASLLGIMDFALFMADYIISGQFLGEDALAGLTAMNPLITFLTFINIIIPAGTLSSISSARAEGNIDLSNKLFSQGIIISLILGVISSIILGVLSSGYVESILLSDNIASYSTSYCKGLIPMPLFMFINTFLYYIHIGEGFENYCIVSSIAKLAVNISLDIILCATLSTFGVGIATTLGYLASLIIKIIPLFNKRFSLKFHFYINLKKMLRLALNGIILSADFICPVLFSSIMNALIVILIGNDGLIVFSVILNIENLFMSLYSYLANSIQSIICQYHTESNLINIKKSMIYMITFICISSIILSITIMVLAPLLPTLFGIDEAGLIAQTTTAIRLYTPFLIFLGITTLLSRYYVYINHRIYGFLLILFSSVIIPAIQLVMAYFLLNEEKAWIGLGIGYLISFIINLFCTNIIRKREKNKTSLLLLLDKNAMNSQLSYNIYATNDDITKCLYMLKDDLEKVDSLTSRRRNLLRFMTEENCLNILDKSTDENDNIEINLIKPRSEEEHYNLIIRSNCIIDSHANDSNKSFREGIIANVMNSSSGNFSFSMKKETLISYKC